MSLHNITHQFTTKVERENGKYGFAGVYFQDNKVLGNWESAAALSLLCTEFGRKELPKSKSYAIEGLIFRHVERNKVHFLQIDVNSQTVHLEAMAVKLFPAILNRVLARCDLLARNTYYDKQSDEFQDFPIFKDFPIQIQTEASNENQGF